MSPQREHALGAPEKQSGLDASKMPAMAPPALQLKASSLDQVEEDSTMQLKEAGGEGFVAPQAPPDSGGGNLPGDLRAGMESISGIDMGDVKVHYNSSAPVQYKAHAYAQGTDIHLGPGQEQHLAHEAWHVVQQKQGRVNPTTEVNGAAVNDQPGLEKEADDMGAKAMQMKASATQAVEVGTISGAMQRVEDPNAPDLATYKGEDLNLPGQISASAKTYQDAVASGMNIRPKPDPSASPISKIKYGTNVLVKATNAGGGWYFVISNQGTAGWISQNFVALNPPDPQAKLHHVTEPNLTTIMKRHYADGGLYKLSTGDDYTTISAAILSANRGRAGIFANAKKKKAYESKHWFRDAVDPSSENFSDYAAAEVVKGANIWLPSPAYIGVLKESGVVATRPDWLNTALDVGDMLVGFNAGMISGIVGSVWDTLVGLYDLGSQIVSTIKKLFTGELFAEIGTIYQEAKAHFDKLAAMSQDELLAYGKNLWNMFTTTVSGAVDNFVAQWTHPDAWKKWFYRGKVVGQIVLEVALAIFTAGAGNAAKWMGVIGKISPKLAKIIRKGLDIADDIVPDRLNNKKRRRDGDDGKDRKDNDGNNDSDGFQNALKLARVATETHDAKDSSIEVLRASLMGIQGTFSKDVRGYDIKQKPGMPGHYKVIQRMAVVDQDYTPGKPRKITRPKWGKKNLYGGREQTAVEHIAEGHFHNSRRGQRSSRFSEKNSNPGRVKELVNEAVAIGEHAGTEENYKVFHTFAENIGTTSDGKKTKRILVYLDPEGNVLNAYPVP